MDNADVLIEYINNMIEEAVMHGADNGGSYNNNQENLVNAMTRFGRWYGLKGYVIINKSGTPQFGKVIKVIDEIKI